MSKLDERIKQYGIPPIPYLPAGKNVLIYRLPTETRTAGGLFIPDAVGEPQPMGVLLSAGLAARDVMVDHLIEVGDVVWWGRFAGWEKEVERDPENKGKKILQMKIEDVLGSVDAIERVKDYDIVLEDDGEGGEQHVYVKKTTKRKAA